MLKVFLAEDETLIREGLRDNIPWEQYGYRFVGEAADGEMALPLILKVIIPADDNNLCSWEFFPHDSTQ